MSEDLAAEHRDRFESADTAVRSIVCEEEFPSPERSVRAVTHAIERDPDDRRGAARDGIFRQACGDVRMMVLAGKERQAAVAGLRSSELCR